jgi:DNA-binding NarL/FixJ family response regulator
MSGIEALRAIRQSSPEARVVIRTTTRADAQAMRAVAGGAAGFLVKDLPRTELLDTIRGVHAGLILARLRRCRRTFDRLTACLVPQMGCAIPTVRVAAHR